MGRALLAIVCLTLTTGCQFLPEITRQPSVFNPFPQLSRVAVAPFFNLSAEPAVDGRQFAQAYFNELQNVPGFEVLPVGVVESKMREHGLSLAGPEEAQRLAQLLGVDAVVVGAVTDFSPYYPPRCALQVEWYSANPCFHPIPPGYGLPWGTTEEELIPGPLIFEAERALAREQLRTQEPLQPVVVPAASPPPAALPEVPADEGTPADEVKLVGGVTDPAASTFATTATALPPDWPDPRGLVPPGPCAARPGCRPSQEPVLRHTKSYNGHDSAVTEALSTYHYFRDDARSGGWQSYLQRSDDFIRFCCHLHIAEMLTARGGAGETRVVWRWPIDR